MKAFIHRGYPVSQIRWHPSWGTKGFPVPDMYHDDPPPRGRAVLGHQWRVRTWLDTPYWVVWLGTDDGRNKTPVAAYDTWEKARDNWERLGRAVYDYAARDSATIQPCVTSSP